MDLQKTGALIRQLRKDARLTQEDLAKQLHVSSKTISKWECGNGCPEISLFPNISNILGIDCAALFSGEVQKNDQISGNMRKTKFYLCENCGNLITSAAKTSVKCCGKVLQEVTLTKADEPLSVELTGEEYYISSTHEMTRDHYITFAAIISSDTLILRKLYPEWDLQIRLPRIAGGILVWHCSRHGLFYQSLPQPIRRTPRNR